jgi:hypothetical protein
MQTVLVGLGAGLMVGVICVAYVFLRTRGFVAAESAAKAGGETSPYSEEVASSSMMLMAVVGSGSLLWGFIAAGLYHLIREDETFFLLSVLLALIMNLGILFSKTTFTLDKILLTTFIILGLGVLIPWLI